MSMEPAGFATKPVAVARALRATGALAAMAFVVVAQRAQASAQIDVAGPAGSVAFGTTVTMLPNGNFVVTDPQSSLGAAGGGAAFLYDPHGQLIATLIGTHADDHVGSGGVTVLATGNYVVGSPSWNSSAGAATFGDAATGVTGVVAMTNSLIGSTPYDVNPPDAGDNVGTKITPLSNGNYVVSSPNWHVAPGVNAGAATLGDGFAGVVGVVSASNSLHGSASGDEVGFAVVPLTLGRYVVVSPYWANGSATAAGAVTWGDSAGLAVGAVGAGNSLVGTHAQDEVGFSNDVGVAVTLLANGNYVVASPYWSSGALPNVGAVTWGSGDGGVSGEISAANSLLGTHPGEAIGSSGVAALANGNYVIASPYWVDGVAQVGAATWATGTTLLTGSITSGNSLVGSTANDQVGYYGVTALSNGDYVVGSPFWSNGNATYAGAATYGDGNKGVGGAIGANNSLVGTTANDNVGLHIKALTNGNYVVATWNWHNGAIEYAGAATFASSSAPVTGAVSASNSLVGTTAYDQVGSFVHALSNGNYVVASPYWTNGATASAGAVTWGSGSAGVKGAVSTLNSLVGTHAGDDVGYDAAHFVSGVVALANGNFAVGSQHWNGNVGAATWGSGTQPSVASVGAGNSLTGSAAGDLVAFSNIRALSDGNYVVDNSEWSNQLGAITFVRGDAAYAATIVAGNSVLGTAPNAGRTMVFDYDAARQQLVVGRPASNIVTLFRADVVFASGFE